MAKRHTKILTLTGKTCRLGNISNNLERHGKEWETGFMIPVTELMLTKAELNSFMRDKDCWTSWYDTSKGSGVAAEPMPWWSGESFRISDTFEADEAMITVSGDRELEFESEGDPKDGDKYRPAIVIEKVLLTPRTGGMTELNCSIYVRPGIGPTNLKLQDHQHREVKLTIVKATVEERKKTQPELPIGEGGKETAPPAEGEPTESSAATH